MSYFFKVRISCVIVPMISISVGRGTNGRVSKGSGESIDVARKEKFTRVIFSKMVIKRKNNGRDRSSGMLLWMKSGTRRCPVRCCKYCNPFYKKRNKNPHRIGMKKSMMVCTLHRK